MTTAQEIAHGLLDIKAVGFKPDQPIRFKSGLLSPVYVDNRIFPYHPKQWRLVIEGFQQLIQRQNLQFDIIAGIETAGIPHSATLGFVLGKPSVFIRKAVKDHGTKKMVEGGDVLGKKVLLIEDHVTTGGSSLHGVRELKNAGAIVTDCLAITSYEFAEADEQFAKGGVRLHTLTNFSIILQEALSRGVLQTDEVETVQAWLKDAKGWEQTL